MHALINIYACNNNLKLINIINKMLVYYIVCTYVWIIFCCCIRFTGQKNAFSTLFTMGKS